MPPRFNLGAALVFTLALAAFPASAGWTLNYRLIPRSALGTAIEFTATASGDEHAVEVAAATTATWVAGTYTWVAWVTSGSDVRDVAQGEITLLPNPRTVNGPLDLRSETRLALDNVRAVLRGKASADVLRYTINGRSLERYPVSELIALESKLVRDLQREEQQSTGRNPRRLVARVARA